MPALVLALAGLVVKLEDKGRENLGFLTYDQFCQVKKKGRWKNKNKN
jgi:hypothetical protein